MSTPTTLKRHRFRRTRGRLSFFLAIGFCALLATMAVGLLVMIADGVYLAWGMLAFVCLIEVAVARQLLDALAIVGRDGVAFRRADGLPRFVPWHAVARIADAPDGTRLVMHDGQDLLAETDDPTTFSQQCRAALIADRELDRIDPPDALLEDSVHRTRGYRELAIPRDVLLRVLEDPAIAHDVRLRAAASLIAGGESARVTAVVGATADPIIRQSLKRLS